MNNQKLTKEEKELELARNRQETFEELFAKWRKTGDKTELQRFLESIKKARPLFDYFQSIVNLADKKEVDDNEFKNLSNILESRTSLKPSSNELVDVSRVWMLEKIIGTTYHNLEQKKLAINHLLSGLYVGALWAFQKYRNPPVKYSRKEAEKTANTFFVENEAAFTLVCRIANELITEYEKEEKENIDTLLSLYLILAFKGELHSAFIRDQEYYDKAMKIVANNPEFFMRSYFFSNWRTNNFELK